VATKQKRPEEEITEEARALLEEAAALERARPVIEAEALLGSVEHQIKLQRIDARIPQLERQAEEIRTPEKLAAVRRRNEEAIRAQEEASHRAHVANFASEEVTRYRREEYHRVGLGLSSRSGRVELPAAVVAQRANAVEDLLGATRVCADDYRREAWYRQNQLSDVVEGTYDEVCERYLGVRARYVRDSVLDRQLGLRMAEDGKLVDAAAKPEENENGEEVPEDVA
jgi:hypothetical protein